ncbi:uncharacterized protein LOC133324777 [Musca vetustissima]|uniref:uncharacterized protein LOC133324777 n=1 Tax=Musca vetustissima TaxID=27455 RepID=UPI002AB61D23|nr:uncharacterized protein LOC133324777 [Musca vetustissima]
MNAFTVVAVFLTLVVAVFGFESSGWYKDPAHPGKCVYKELILSPGEEGQPKGECVRFLCGDSSGFATLQGCGVEDVQPPCKLGDYIDPKGPYAKCCERHIICPKS